MISERVKSGVANVRLKGKIVGKPKLKLSDIPKKSYKHMNYMIMG